MSRSYKHTPIVKSSSPIWRKAAKKRANKTVRRFKGEVSNKMYYKKIFPQWDIFDYISYCPYYDKPYWMSDDYWKQCYVRK